MSPNVNMICKSGYYYLRNIRQIRKYLSKDSAEKLIHAFVTSRLDNCNSLLYGLPACTIAKLQRLQNAAARTIMQVPKFCHISPILSSLHWLPVKYRIDFRIILTTFKAIHGLGPKYLSELLHFKLTTVSDQTTCFCSRPLNVKLFPRWVTERLQLLLHASGTLYPKLLETLMISLH